MEITTEADEPPRETRYQRIREKIQHLTRVNLEQRTKDVLGIFEEGEITSPTERQSIFEELVDKTLCLYKDPSFAKLVKELYSSYQRSPQSRDEDLFDVIWKKVEPSYFWIWNESEKEECIAKLKIFLPLDAGFSTRFLQRLIVAPLCKSERNVHFVRVLTFLIREGADPFHPIGGTDSFTLFLDKFGLCLNFSSDSDSESTALTSSIINFLKEALSRWEASNAKESTVNGLIKIIPSSTEDSSHLSLIELIVENCLDMIKINPELSDHVDSKGRTALHNLIGKLVSLNVLLERIPQYAAGYTSVWNLMSQLVTEKNVNMRDEDQVTPYSWILSWQESVTLQGVQDKQELTRKIEDIKKHFQEKGAREEDAAHVLGSWRYPRIREKIQRLTRKNIKQRTEDVLGILEEGEISWPTEGPSIFEELVNKTSDLYQEPSFAKLVKEFYSSYQRSTRSRDGDLFDVIWRPIRSIWIGNESKKEECIAKIKIFLPLDVGFSTRFLHRLLNYCNKRERNVHFVEVLTFLIREGADPFHPIGGTDSFTLFLEKFDQLLGGSSDSDSKSTALTTSIINFLKEALSKWETSRTEKSIVNDLIKLIPSTGPQGDSSNFQSLIELIVENCLKMIKIDPALCDRVDRKGRTPLHNLLEKLLNVLLKRIPQNAAGYTSLWNLMSQLVTEKNVNMRDKDQVTPYCWIVWWHESVTLRCIKDKQELTRKIEDIKKQFQEKGAREEDAAHGVGSWRYRRIEEKIQHLTRANLEQQTKDVLKILEEGEITWPTEGPSILKKLVYKTDDLYQEPSFAKLVKTHLNMATANPSPDHCLKEKCLVTTKKKDKDEMIRCIICCVWHHAGCVSVARKDTSQIWTCFLCRVLPENVYELKKEMTEMHAMQKELMELVRSMQNQLQSETEEKKKIASELESLRNSLNDIKLDSSENTRKTHADSQTVSATPPSDVPETPPDALSATRDQPAEKR